jgi:hypothetical protein
MNVVGMGGVFTLFVFVALALLTKVLTNFSSSHRERPMHIFILPDRPGRGMSITLGIRLFGR